MLSSLSLTTETEEAAQPREKYPSAAHSARTKNIKDQKFALSTNAWPTNWKVDMILANIKL